MSQQEESRLLPAVRASQGAVVVTGPTGSGKSSTVYALASEINTRDKSIVSVEDPVEYRVDGIKQIQINTRAGMTFPSALRSILRSDPDVIVIGEVRDSETARIAADASITGHLVFSTLHAHRAAAAPARLIEMGVEPYLVATALTSVVAQRLVRRLCEQCAAPLSADLDQLRHFGADESILDAEITMRRAVGCSACLNSGYRGRSAVFEILTVTEELAHLVVQQAASAEIERLAVAQGMDTMRSAALRRVVRGELTLEEVARVLS
jgi:type II secretory ATPase GspE/PulE/Tfp pilus assembly ATPase PilB-like protein